LVLLIKEAVCMRTAAGRPGPSAPPPAVVYLRKRDVLVIVLVEWRGKTASGAGANCKG
jgi:hypothetical protein